MNICKVGITGGSGMVGQQLKAVLISKKIEIVDINRDLWDLSKSIEIEELDQLLNGVEVIFHFGAYVPINSIVDEQAGIQFDTNVKPCLRLAEWSLKRNVKLIFLSGAIVYNDCHARNIVESDQKVINGFGGFYGLSKLLAEQVFEHFRMRGLCVCILRPTSVYGVAMPESRLVASFLKKALYNEPIVINEPVDNKINFINSFDLVRACILAIENNQWGTFNVAGARLVTIKELAQSCIDVVGCGILEIKPSLVETKPFHRFDLNCNLAKKKLNYTPQIDLAKGLEHMLRNEFIL